MIRLACARGAAAAASPLAGRSSSSSALCTMQARPIASMPVRRRPQLQSAMIAPLRRAAAASVSAAAASAPALQRRGFTSSRPTLSRSSSNSNSGGGQPPFPPPPPFTPIPLNTVVDAAIPRGKVDVPWDQALLSDPAVRRRYFNWRTLAVSGIGFLSVVGLVWLGSSAWEMWCVAREESEEFECALKHRDSQAWRTGGAPLTLPFLSAEEEAAAEAAKTPAQFKEEARERRELLAQLKAERPAADKELQGRIDWLATHSHVYTLGLEPAAEPATPEVSLAALLSFVSSHPLPGMPAQFKTGSELLREFARGTVHRPDPPQLAWQLLEHVEALRARAQFLISHPLGWEVSDAARLSLARDLLKEAVSKRTQLLQYMHLHALRFPRELQPLSMVQAQFTSLAMDLADLGREDAVERVINEGIKPLAGLALARLDKAGKQHPHAKERSRAHFNDAIASTAATLCEQAEDWLESAAYRRASVGNKLVILGLVSGEEAMAAAQEDDDNEVAQALALAAANSEQLSAELMRLSYVEAAASQTPEALSLPAATLASARAQSVIHAAQAVELAQYRLMRELGPDNEAELNEAWTEEDAQMEAAQKEQAQRAKQQARMQKQLQDELKTELAANSDEKNAPAPAAAAAAAAPLNPSSMSSPIDPVAALEATAASLAASSAAASALLSPEAALEQYQLDSMFALLNTNLPLTLERPFLEEQAQAPEDAAAAAVDAKDKLHEAQELALEQELARDAVAAVLDDPAILAALDSTLREHVAHLTAAHELATGWLASRLGRSAGLRLQIAQAKESLARPYAQLARALEIQGEQPEAAQRARDMAEKVIHIEQS